MPAPTNTAACQLKVLPAIVPLSRVGVLTVGGLPRNPINVGNWSCNVNVWVTMLYHLCAVWVTR